jgi:hypothetical protein
MKQRKQIGVRGLQVKTGVKAGADSTLSTMRIGLNNSNHNETLVRDLPRLRGMRVKTGDTQVMQLPPNDNGPR